VRRIDALSTHFRALFSRRRLERELDAELRFHLHQQVEENLAAGMSLDESFTTVRRIEPLVALRHE